MLNLVVGVVLVVVVDVVAMVVVVVVDVVAVRTVVVEVTIVLAQHSVAFGTDAHVSKLKQCPAVVLQFPAVPSVQSLHCADSQGKDDSGFASQKPQVAGQFSSKRAKPGPLIPYSLSASTQSTPLYAAHANPSSSLNHGVS